jgi:hypothetical protein
VIPIYLHVISNYISSVGMMFCLMALMFALTIGILYFIEWIVYRKFEMESPNEGSENDILINEFLNNGWTLKHPSA